MRMTDDLGAFSFLFNSSAPSAPTWYGGLFDPAFLAALKGADPLSQTKSWLLRGDLLLSHLGSRITRVERGERGASHTQGYDPDVIKTAIFDFSEWVRSPPSRFDITKLQDAFLRLNVAHCITVVSVGQDIALEMDRILQSEPLYLGMASIDLGNPVMRTLLVEYLIKDAGVDKGRIWFAADFDGDVHSLFEGADSFHPAGKGVLQSGGLHKRFGALPVVPLSTAGRDAAYRHEQKSRLTLQERVIARLAYDYPSVGGGPFRFDALGDDSLFEAVVPPPKLTSYALNPDHPDGAGKAKFFKEVLAIGPDDWRFLMAQIQEGVLVTDLTDIQIKQWPAGLGASFNAVLPVVGRNGRTANIFTNWIMEPDQAPRLSTIRPAAPDEGDLQTVEPPLVGAGLEGDVKWEALFDLAHIRGTEAHDSAVPTPLFVHGFGGHADGACGFAYVHVPDARRNFARWLLKSGRAYKGYKGGATLSCPRKGQSVDRAYAYAQAFARVLEYNGVVCTVERRLD
jgi:hypothetical protein